MTILAALIEYDVDGVTKYLGVTDKNYKDTTGVSLEDGLWYPALSSDVNWSESARHPYQEQGGELVVGDLVLANDGTFDFLMDADIVGMKVTLKRGDRDESWADMEQIFIARIAGRRFEGHSVIIELDNWLAKLSGPVFTETFDSDTPNPQLVGKQIPYVLGKVTQAPVLLYDANNLTYYTAYNASLIGEVAEGGNPTQKWTLEDEPTFDLLGSPTLPITATFEGPGNDRVDLLSSIGSFDSWTSGEPDGWTVYDYDPGGLSSSDQSNLGAISEVATGASVTSNYVLETTGTHGNIDSGEGVSEEGLVTEWQNPNNLTSTTSVAQLDYVEGVRNQRIKGVGFPTVFSGPVYKIDAPYIYNSFYFSIYSEAAVTSGQLPKISNIAVKSDAIDASVPISAYDIPDAAVRVGAITENARLWGSDYEYIDQLDFANMEVTLSIETEGEGSVGLRNLRESFDLRQPWPINLYWDGMTAGRRYIARVHYDSSGQSISAIASSVALANDDVLTNADRTNVALLDGTGSADLQVEADDTVFGLSFLTREGTETGEQIITQVELFEQQAANTSYKTLAPKVITQVGYTSSEYDQTSFDDHADEYGDPELGWLITKNETADQVLFRLAGSLNGYVWHGLDGKVRSKRLKAPTPVDDPFVIDSARANPADIVAYDDPAPNLRKSVNALRNWKPLDTDDTAGITTTWTEEDRAKVTTDWRITRAWEMGTDGKDEFTRRWPMVASREPFATALRDATTCQLIANEGPDTWIQRPMFYEIPVYVDKGEFPKVATGETVKAELDYPGLEDTWLLVLGRSGTATPGVVNLTLWSADQSPVALLAPYRFDPRITFTRNSTATYFDSDGVLQTAAADEARMDYGPDTGDPKGWLFEDSRTNLLTHSEQIDNAAWAKVGFNVTANAETAPDGTETADRVEQQNADSNDRIQQSVTVSADTDYTLSFWVKKGPNHTDGDDSRCNIRYTGGTTVDSSQTFTPTDEWQRVVFTLNSGTGNTSAAVRPVRGIGLDDDLYIWGVQFEEASEVSSYIPTVASTATRAKDVSKLDGSDFTTLWNSGEGTIVVEFDKSRSEGAFNRVFEANDGTTGNQIRAFLDSSGSTLSIDTKASGSITGSIDVTLTQDTNRLALSVDGNELNVSVNGATVVTDTAGEIPATLIQIEFGNLLGGNQLDGWIPNFYYYPNKVTDSQLESASEVGRDLILDKV